MRRPIVATLLLVLGLTVAPREDSHAADTFGITPDKKLAKLLEKAADACFECGDEAKSLGLYSYTRSFFNHALEYDPDHRGTRRVMGYKKQKGVWVLEEDLVPKGDEIIEARRAEFEGKLATRTSEIRRKPADELWKYAADEKNPRDQRMVALYHVLRLYPEHREARNAARVSTGERGLVHALDEESDVLRIKWIQAERDGSPIEEKTPYEEAGFPMENRRGDWVVVHAAVGDNSAEWARTLTQYAEAARKRALGLTGIAEGTAPEADTGRLHFTVFQEREAFASFVEKCSNIKDDTRRRAGARSAFGVMVYNPDGAAFLQPDTSDDHWVRDAIAHELGTGFVGKKISWNGYWLARGMGYLTSSQMNGSIVQRFWVPKSTGVVPTGGREALPDLGHSAANWRLTVAMDVAGGKPLAMGELAAVKVADYGEREMAFAFCYAEYLTRAHHEKLAAFFASAWEERLRRNKEKLDDETAAELVQRLMREIGVTEAAFAEAFATWVSANYIRLPGQD